MTIFHTLMTRTAILLLAFYLGRKFLILVVIRFSLDYFNHRASDKVFSIKMKRIVPNIVLGV